MTKFGSSAHRALGLLSECSIGVLSPDDPNYGSVEYGSWLDGIESQLSSIRQELQQNDSHCMSGTQSESVEVKELFVLASMLYFERVSKQLVGPSLRTDKITDDAFELFSRVETCNKPFPLLIFGGLETQTDSRRLTILEVIDRTMKETRAGSLVALRDLLVRLWVQDDLNADGSLYYIKASCFFLRMCNFVPCLL